MSVLQQILAAVESSNSDVGKKAVVEAFLTGAAPVVEALGPSVFQQVMAAAAAGTVPQEVVEQLSAQQVAALLEQAEEDISALAAKHGAEVAAWNTAMGQLQAAALAAVARALMTAL